MKTAKELETSLLIKESQNQQLKIKVAQLEYTKSVYREFFSKVYNYIMYNNDKLDEKFTKELFELLKGVIEDNEICN